MDNQNNSGDGNLNSENNASVNELTQGQSVYGCDEERVNELTEAAREGARRREQLDALRESDEAKAAREEVARRTAGAEPTLYTDYTRAIDKIADELRAMQKKRREEEGEGIAYPRKVKEWPPYMAHHHFDLRAEDVRVAWMADTTRVTRAHLLDELVCPNCAGDGRVISERDQHGYSYAMPCACAPWRKVVDEFARAGLPASATGHRLETMNWSLIEARRLIQRTLGPSGWEPVNVRDEARRITLGGDHEGARRHGLLLFGRSGTAKSHIIQGLIIESIFAGKRARWCHWPHLLRRMKATFNKHSREHIQNVFSWATNTDVLAIEEIGGEKVTDWAREQLEAMLTKCEDNGITVLISTNYGSDRLVEEVGGAAVSRMQGLCEIVEMRGRDYRAMSTDERAGY